LINDPTSTIRFTSKRHIARARAPALRGRTWLPAAPRRSIRSCRSICPSSSPGPRSVRAPRNRRPTGNGERLSTPVGFRTVPTGRSPRRSMRSNPCAIRIISWGSPAGQSAVFRTRGNQQRTWSCAAGWPGQLRRGEHRARRAAAGAGESAAKHRGRLQPWQFQQGSERSAAGGENCVAQILDGNRSIIA